MRIFVYGTLVLFGVAPEDIILVNAINAFYQYLLHSELWPQFKGWESIFVTPKYHQIHHSSVREHLDTNYGGMLSIWDRLFGTFHLDSKKITYGLTKPLENNDPLHLQFIFFHKLIHNFRVFPIKKAIALLFLGPEAQTPDLPNSSTLKAKYSYPSLISGFCLFSLGYSTLSLSLLPLWVSILFGLVGILVYCGFGMGNFKK